MESNQDLPGLMEAIIDEHKAIAIGIYDWERQRPWIAPVYYVYRKYQFYFFSDPGSAHVAGLSSRDVIDATASIFNEPEDYQHIRGLQMSGKIQVVTDQVERGWALAAFEKRFSFFEKILRDFEWVKRINKTRIYKFSAEEIFIVDNRLGFGKRLSFKPE